MPVDHASYRRMLKWERVEEKLSEALNLISDCWKSEDKWIDDKLREAYHRVHECRERANEFASDDPELKKILG